MPSYKISTELRDHLNGVDLSVDSISAISIPRSILTVMDDFSLSRDPEFIALIRVTLCGTKQSEGIYTLDTDSGRLFVFTGILFPLHLTIDMKDPVNSLYAAMYELFDRYKNIISEDELQLMCLSIYAEPVKMENPFCISLMHVYKEASSAIST